jgi:hypothetical protein
MINIKRAEQPESLDTPEIRDYINRSVQYLNDPKIFKKPDTPVAYRNCDLLEAFDRDFFSKCYLTEQKFPNSWIMDIEHFIPQCERPDLVYEWSNLFPAEHHANMIKPRKTPKGGYLNPCDPNDDVENEIIYSLSTHGFAPAFFAKNDSNLKAVNTCDLLKRLHNGHDNNTNKLTETLRHAIHKKYIAILKKIIEYQQQPNNSSQKYQALRELRDYLSRKSSFTMLCRSIPAVLSINVKLFD